MPANDKTNNPTAPELAAPPPNSKLANPWRIVVFIPVTPICPMCADTLEPHNVSVFRGVAFCQVCSTRARAANWPEPYAFEKLFNPTDLCWAQGIAWYHPRDHRQEPAVSRRIRTDVIERKHGPLFDLPAPASDDEPSKA